jgi:IclR family KDG regulon transcriptional repressor
VNQSAQRTLQLLEYLAEHGASSLSTISTDLGLNISTAHRFASALVQRGYPRQDPLTRHYLLTTKVVNVSSQVLDRLEIRAEVRPFLEELSRLTSETAHLAILDHLEIVYSTRWTGVRRCRCPHG